MIVRKVRGQNKIGKVIMSTEEVALMRKIGVPIEKYIRMRLIQIAKERRWKWYPYKEAL